MYIFLILSTFSLAGIVIILGRSHGELAPIEVSFLNKFSEKAALEKRIPKILDLAKGYLVRGLLFFEQKFYFLLDIWSRAVGSKLNRLNRWARARLELVRNSIAGRGEYNKKGSSSIFLKNLSDHKELVKENFGSNSDSEARGGI